MRSKFLSLAALLIFLPSLGAAQEETRRNEILPLHEGGFVAFKNQIAPAGTINTAAAGAMQGVVNTRAFLDENHVIHRVLLDADGRYIFAYDVVIEAVQASNLFNIAVTPLDLLTEKKLLASSAEPQPLHIATLPQSAEPHILDDGDSIALDLLVNQKTGVKIVDLVKVSFDRSNLWDDNPRNLPRDFTLDAVPLRVIDFRLLVDGNLVAAGKPGTKFAGTLIWCYVEGQGRFIFSLVPREGYDFQKVGIIGDQRIEFTVKGKHYEWLSSEPILPSGGTWNLWMLHDPTYLPFGTQEVSKQEKSRLDEMDDSIKAFEEKVAKMRDPAPTSAFRKTTEARKPDAVQPTPKRFKVMVGAADRIENLWPK